MGRRISDQSAGARRLRTQQLGLLRLLFRDIRGVMGLLVPSRPASARPWMEAVGRQIEDYSRMAAELGARAYEAERDDAGARHRFRPDLADPPAASQVEASLRWAGHGVWEPPEPPAALAPAERRPFASDIAERLLAQAAERTEAAAGRLVLDTSRRTVVEASRRDPAAVGWYRSASPAGCAFCKLMASRGAVYHSRDTAGAEANERFVGDGLFKYHNNCQCVAMPLLRGDTFELSPDALEWDRIYDEYARGHSGDQLRRFRTALRVIEAGGLPSPEDFGDRA